MATSFIRSLRPRPVGRRCFALVFGRTTTLIFIALLSTLGNLVSAGAATLAAALDATNLVWTTGGNASWFPQSTVAYYRTNAAQSGVIGDSQESWLETTVTGPGPLSFWWKVSSEAGFDELQFAVNGVEQFSVSGTVDWQQRTLNLPSGNHILRWRYVKDSSTSEGLDRGWVDWVSYSSAGDSAPVITTQPVSRVVGEGVNVTFNVSASATPPPGYQWFLAGSPLAAATNSSLTLVTVSTNDSGPYTVVVSNYLGSVTSTPAILTVTVLAQALDTTNLTWTTGGESAWFGQFAVTHDGQDAAASGSITNSQQSWVQTVVTGPGSVSFWWKVSSETNWDGLQFFTNGVPIALISGEVGWQQRTYDLASGSQALRWRYSKDGSLNAGLDTGWLDQVTIIPPPTISISDASVTEGNGGGVNAVFTVSLSAASGQSVSVSFTTEDGSALAAQDYLSTNGLVTFPPGTTNQTITVRVSGDLQNESNEVFVVTLFSPLNATLADGQGQGTITNDDPLPSLSITDVTVGEGDAGGANALFTVSLSAESGRMVSVNFSTADGTAASGADYLATNGVVTFAAGTINQTIAVRVNGDLLNESNETFVVNLASPLNATLGDGQGLGTITNDDPLPSISIGDVTVSEGNAGFTNAVFTVSLSAASGQVVSANFATADGTALAAQDYLSTNGLVNFPSGTTNQTITVRVSGDLLNETNETLLLNLGSPVNATLAGGQAVGTIINDDPLPAITITDVAVSEGNAGVVGAVFTVSLSAASGQPVSASFDTTDVTATAGQDYLSTNGSVNFPPGMTNQTLVVLVNGDLLNEINETFLVNLSSPLNAKLGDRQGQGTINNDDTLPSLSITDVAISEGSNGVTNALFAVSLSAASGQTVSVSFTTTNASALAGEDYLATNGMVTFAIGTTNQTITVRVYGDLLNETNETFLLNLSSPVNATLTDSQAVGTILNDDFPPQPVVISSMSLSSNGNFTVWFQGDSNRLYTVRTSTNLISWEFLTNLISASNTFWFVDPAAGARQRRFYQLWTSP